MAHHTCIAVITRSQLDTNGIPTADMECMGVDGDDSVVVCLKNEDTGMIWLYRSIPPIVAHLPVLLGKGVNLPG